MLNNLDRRSIEFNCPICHLQQKITMQLQDGNEVGVACESGQHAFIGVASGRSLKFSGKVMYASNNDVGRLARELSEKTTELDHAYVANEKAARLLDFYRKEMIELFAQVEARNEDVENISFICDAKKALMMIDDGLNFYN